MRTIPRTHTVKVYRATKLADPDSGDIEEVWAEQAEEDWNLDPISSVLRPTAPGEIDKATLMGFAPCDSVVGEDDRLVIVGGTGRDYGTLKVTGVGDVRSDSEDWDLEVDLVKVDENVP